MPARGPVHPPPGFGNRNQAMFPPGLNPAMGNLNLGGQDRAPPFMNPAPPGLFAAHGPPSFSPPFPMMGPGYFPGSNGPPLGRPPLMDMYGPMMGGDNVNKNGNHHHHQQQPHPGPPPGFPRQD